ncbi:hypothetical protein QG37_02873 [Candidozyma auris]|uniref:Uncharacterized protein n=1 Tax=Candidozyma auris TaxID=498019 RepID=A0A0L0P212_CANAR|nr:hypothetical protein QG37_02873 [[Candida] auris]
MENKKMVVGGDGLFIYCEIREPGNPLLSRAQDDHGCKMV